MNPDQHHELEFFILLEMFNLLNYLSLMILFSYSDNNGL
jgi:hypothetical protein